MTFTTQRAGLKKNKMAGDSMRVRDLEREGSLFIDSILSQGEEDNVILMLCTANELDDGVKLPSFYTSSQMGGKIPSRMSNSPALSPITSYSKENRSYSYDIPKFTLDPHKSSLGQDQVGDVAVPESKHDLEAEQGNVRGQSTQAAEKGKEEVEQHDAGDSESNGGDGKEGDGGAYDA